MSYRGNFVYELIGRFFDRLAEKWLEPRARPREFGEPAIKIIPNTDPDRVYHDWVNKEWAILHEIPDVQLTITNCQQSVDEMVQIIVDSDPLVTHSGHKGEDCLGEPLRDGLRKILDGQPSTWGIRYAMPGLISYNEPNIGMLELFLAQEFEGHAPGKPNRDYCHVHLGRDLAPMEFEVRIPHYGIKNNFCVITYLKIDLKIDPEVGVVITGHEDNMDPRP